MSKETEKFVVSIEPKKFDKPLVGVVASVAIPQMLPLFLVILM